MTWDVELSGMGFGLKFNGQIRASFLDAEEARRAADCLNACEGYPAPPAGMMAEIVGTLKSEPCSCHDSEICRRCRILKVLSS